MAVAAWIGRCGSVARTGAEIAWIPACAGMTECEYALSYHDRVHHMVRPRSPAAGLREVAAFGRERGATAGERRAKHLLWATRTG